MRIALIRCPWWVRYCPPYILAFFKTWLETNGHSADIYDFNNSMYYDSSPEYRQFWDDRDYYSLWENKTFIQQLLNEGIYQKNIDDIISSGADVICFTTHTPNTIISQEMARMIKETDPSKIIVFMGHKSSKAQMAYDFASDPNIDYVCPGEADLALLELLEVLKDHKKDELLPPVKGFLKKDVSGNIIDCGTADIIEDLDNLPFPDYDCFVNALGERPYSQPGRLDILDSRGCINSCHFCYERLYWQGYRSMSGRKIFEQIQYHKKHFPALNYVYFNGLLLNGDLGVLDEFSTLAIENDLDVKWAGQAMIRKDMTLELLQKMYKAGCQWLYYGIESGSQEVLRSMNKNYLLEDAIRVLRDSHEVGMEIQINIMFGYPSETEYQFKETLEFLTIVRPYIDNVLASQSFCTLEKETYMRSNPEEFSIEDASHHLYWSSQNGVNNYIERYRRYEVFCEHAIALGLPETSGVLRKKPDKWQLHGDYFYHIKDFSKAIKYYKQSLKEEEISRIIYKKIADSYLALDQIDPALEFFMKALEFDASGFGSEELTKEIKAKMDLINKK